MLRIRTSLLTLFTLFSCVLTVVAGEPGKPFVIHEWGTFTVLQNEQGHTLPGVNLNEESLPAFVFRLSPALVHEGQFSHPLLRPLSKGLPSHLLQARMRMETPIIYIYPPDNQPRQIDVRVEFQGGWISEWFPHADVTAPGLDQSHDGPGRLSPDSRGSITWKNLTTNSDQPLESTAQHVWLAPREVQAPALHAEGGQAEKYLFYRGVANIEAPLQVQSAADRNSCRIVRNQTLGNWEGGLRYRAMWLVDISENGQTAFRRIDLTQQDAGQPLVSSCDSRFTEQDYDPLNLDRLKAEMKQTLVAEGLYEDEANAMLKTWEVSYFKSPGRRLFFTLPRDWTDRILPLEVSQKSDIERVMIGRIELITPRQRELLAELNSQTISDPGWFSRRLYEFEPEQVSRIYNSLANGSKQVTDFDFDVPADFRLFLKLGRFREALISDAANDENADGLRRFAHNYDISVK